MSNGITWTRVWTVMMDPTSAANVSDGVGATLPLTRLIPHGAIMNPAFACK
ncbi:hypothetical protein SRABI26_00462 [Arthrobacter sp. Bi26]|nr:hypothetical protein SRABI26_00462 [Arthrobacter sp. Bi26]